jgi:DNA-directed RNA polymerase subunit RPC12/RpoP
MFRVTCPTCGTSYELPDEVRGTAGRCKECGERIALNPATGDQSKYTLDAMVVEKPAALPSAKANQPLQARRAIAVRSEPLPRPILVVAGDRDRMPLWVKRLVLWPIFISFLFFCVVSIGLVATTRPPAAQIATDPAAGAGDWSDNTKPNGPADVPPVQHTDTDAWRFWAQVKYQQNPAWRIPVFKNLADISSVNYCDITFEVLQIVDSSSLLAQHGGETVMLSGFDTDGMVDGRTHSPRGLFKPTGAFRYTSVLGAKKSVASYHFVGPAPRVNIPLDE